MSVIGTDSTRFSAVVKFETEPQLGLCRESVVINEAAATTYKVGAVLGKVTATGKYKLMDPAAVDGSQTFAGIYIADGAGHSGDLALSAGTDAKAIILARGHAIVAKDALTWHTNVDTQGEKDTAYAAMKAELILPETSA